MRVLIQLGFGKVCVPVCSSLLRHEKKKRKILFYSSIVCCFLCHLIFFVCVCCLPRDFQFGHMDGNDYINSLIMG